jgi:hypothetical protein
MGAMLLSMPDPHWAISKEEKNPPTRNTFHHHEFRMSI